MWWFPAQNPGFFTLTWGVSFLPYLHEITPRSPGTCVFLFPDPKAHLFQWYCISSGYIHWFKLVKYPHVISPYHHDSWTIHGLSMGYSWIVHGRFALSWHPLRDDASFPVTFWVFGQIYLGKFHHDLTTTETHRCWFFGEIIPFHGFISG